jgi:GNAT superfamily N-acetyltransferase
MPAIRIQPVAVDRVRPLRASILRPGRPLGESTYALDDHVEAAHFGAVVDTSGEIVGSASVFREAASGDHVPNIHRGQDAWRAANAWRLRGMTVVESMRGRGLGAALLRAALGCIVERGGGCLWFHARTQAEGFYQRYGFSTIGWGYDLAPLGHHVFMWRDLRIGNPGDRP